MLCLVTDRRRLTSADTSAADARRCLVEQARHAVEAGIDLIQLRERDLEARDLAALARELLAVTRSTPTRLLVNDRLDVALACGADGVHLRGDSIAVAAARRIPPDGFLIGRSVHSVDEAGEAAGADYVIAGTVFRLSRSRRTDAPRARRPRAIVQAVAAPCWPWRHRRKECDAVAEAGRPASRRSACSWRPGRGRTAAGSGRAGRRRSPTSCSACG